MSANNKIDYDLTGQKFNDLVVIKRSYVRKAQNSPIYGPYNSKQTAWICKCTCGNEVVVKNYLLVGNIKKNCGCKRLSSETKPSELLTKQFLEEHYIRLNKNHVEIAVEFGIKSPASVAEALNRHGIEVRKIKPATRSGCGELYGQTLASIKHRAKRDGLEYSVEPEYLWDLFIKQDKKCAISGVELSLDITNNKRPTASLDRIDNTKGYVINNVQWTHKTINFMRHTLSVDELKHWCKVVVEYNS
jgi:hypothetical protein